MKTYHAEVAKRLELKEGRLGKLKWMLPVGTDGTTAIVQPHLDPYLAATMAGYGHFDRFVMERYVFGWRPASFIDRKLRPFVNGE
ncbi:hypothetical protein [Catenulispora rubra]|uniref:hypothetical protein n=1 Tax=Catenulispora rubra TaxID=280293 RepID=UPI0018922015|nr:hypothetical protein [Catenulispora rubra]